LKSENAGSIELPAFSKTIETDCAGSGSTKRIHQKLLLVQAESAKAGLNYENIPTFNSRRKTIQSQIYRRSSLAVCGAATFSRLANGLQTDQR
jgi:hypothetical protein